MKEIIRNLTLLETGRIILRLFSFLSNSLSVPSTPISTIIQPRIRPWWIPSWLSGPQMILTLQQSFGLSILAAIVLLVIKEKNNKDKFFILVIFDSCFPPYLAKVGSYVVANTNLNRYGIENVLAYQVGKIIQIDKNNLMHIVFHYSSDISAPYYYFDFKKSLLEDFFPAPFIAIGSKKSYSFNGKIPPPIYLDRYAQK